MAIWVSWFLGKYPTHVRGQVADKRWEFCDSFVTKVSWVAADQKRCAINRTKRSEIVGRGWAPQPMPPDRLAEQMWIHLKNKAFVPHLRH
jgi:hypothetical protein